ncbi:MAG: hypothetical protein OFPII_19850 [Osedax symbiont Rs1]|nr:MAG: hypothetical protein OFPII_19850 [Osedax symbiont Rs1]
MEKQLPQIELLASTAQGSVSSFPFSQPLDSGIFVNATMTIAGIEVQTIDVALLVLCPIFAALGVMVAALVNVKSPVQHGNIVKRLVSDVFANAANLFIGIVAGIVISLFFVGAINNDITSLARVLVLTIFLGYKAPLFWNNQKDITAAPAPVAKALKAGISLSPDALKQEKIKRARLKLAAKN